MKTFHFISGLFFSMLILMHCKEKPALVFQNKAHQLVAEVVANTGNYEQLRSLKNVRGTYKVIVEDSLYFQSEVAHIFEGEKSWESYSYPAKEGMQTREKGFDGQQSWVIHNGAQSFDSLELQRARDGLKTGFYLLTMNQKLLDQGIRYRYVRLDSVQGNFYDVVELTFDEDTGDYQDTFHLYINQKTKLVDQYLCTVQAFGVHQPELVRVKHASFGPLQLCTHLQYTQSNWDGEVLGEKWIHEIWEGLEFDQDFKIEKP